MITEDTIDGIIAILTSILVFKSMTYIPEVEALFKQYPLWILFGSLLLFFFRKKIIGFFKGR